MNLQDFNFEDSKISGLYYVPNYLTKKEQRSILKFLKEKGKWKHIGNNNTRRVIQYGYSYSYDRSGIKKIDPILNYFKKIIDKERVNKFLNKKILKEDFEQLIINEYKPSQGIYPHIDHEKFFGTIILCLTVGSGTCIDFINKTDSNKKKSIYVQPGSLYIMSGDARYKWKHGIRKKLYDSGKRRGTRYSLTYRTIKI